MSHSSPREVIGLELSRRPRQVPRGSAYRELSAQCAVALRTGELRRVALESRPSPRSTLARVFQELTRAARLRRFERMAERLAFPSRAGSSRVTGAASPSRKNSCDGSSRGVAGAGRVSSVRGRRTMTVELHSWQSLHDVVGTILASASLEGGNGGGVDRKSQDGMKTMRERMDFGGDSRTSPELASMPSAETSVLRAPHGSVTRSGAMGLGVLAATHLPRHYRRRPR
jgi:hypothetical protein